MEQYIQPPLPETRSRGNSGASAKRYRPDNYPPPLPMDPAGPEQNYAGPPPTQDYAVSPPVQNYTAPPPPPSASGYTAPRPIARGPSLGNQEIASVPAVPNPEFYDSPQRPRERSQPPVPNPAVYGSSPTPNRQREISQPPYPTSIDRDGYMQPPPEIRRPRAASAHSQRSHHSRYSHDDERRSHHSHHSHDYDEGRRSHDSRHSHHSSKHSHDHDRDEDRAHHHHHHDDDIKPKRVNSHRPTLGDTMFGMFKYVKMAFEPRDKY